MRYGLSILFRRFTALSGLLIYCLALSGCLQTRTAQKEQDEKQIIRKQLSTLQQSTADVNPRFQELEDENRRLNGRIEAVEVKAQQTLARLEKSQQAGDARSKENNDAYREEFANLKGEITRLREQLAAMQAEQQRAQQAREQAREQAKAEAEAQGARAAAAEAKAAEAAKNPFAQAEAKFAKKDWRGAILDYEKYRSQNQKGRSFSTATYKIGVCFQELGMTEEAKAFYDEVIAKFPKSKDAEKSLSRLKNIKAKK